jgi:hypothetical protein
MHYSQIEVVGIHIAIPKDRKGREEDYVDRDKKPEYLLHELLIFNL